MSPQGLLTIHPVYYLADKVLSKSNLNSLNLQNDVLYFSLHLTFKVISRSTLIFKIEAYTFKCSLLLGINNLCLNQYFFTYVLK